MLSIWRIDAVKAAIGYRSHASIYTAIKAGLFTKPVLMGPRAVGWPSDEVQAIIAARIAGKTESEIRELVNRLHVNRSNYGAP
jgi:prophage regulatory protein